MLHDLIARDMMEHPDMKVIVVTPDVKDLARSQAHGIIDRVRVPGRWLVRTLPAALAHRVRCRGAERHDAAEN